MQKVIIFCLGVFYIISPVCAEDDYGSFLNTEKTDRYYPSKIRFAGQASTEHRGSFYVDYLFPVWYAQDENSLIFFNPKETLHTNSSDELNLGIGYRKIFWDKFIGGVHFFYDRKNSPNEVTHQQVGWGLELLSEPIDFRFNYYDPTSGIKVVDTTYFFGSTRLLVSQQREEPLEGFDFEAGIPIDILDTRAYAGGFFYNSKIANDVEGYRIRTETNLNNWLSLDLEMNSKNKQETEFVGGLRVTIPLEFGKLLDRKESVSKVLDIFQVKQRSRLRERLLERVVRDIDIQTSSQTTAPVASTNTDVQEIVYVDNSNTGAEDGTRDHPYDTIAEALVDGRLVSGVTIYVSQGTGALYKEKFFLPDGVLLWGSGYNGGYSGIGAPGYPIIDGEGIGDIITLGDNNTVMGCQVQNSATGAGIYGLNKTGLNIRHNVITDFSAGGGFDQPITLLYTIAGDYTVRVEDNILTRYTGPTNGSLEIWTIALGVNLNAVVSRNTIYNNNMVGIHIEANNASNYTVLISDNNIISNGFAGMSIRSSNASTLNVTLSGNRVSLADDGVILRVETGGGLTVSGAGNSIYSNRDDGVSIESLGAGTLNIDLGGGPLGSTGNNSIYNNNTFDMNNTTAFSVSAENNWWGTATPVAGQFNGDVDYTPWLTSDPN